MKKNILFMGLLALGMGVGITSCSSDDDDEPAVTVANYTDSWGTYSSLAASYLEIDAAKLYTNWLTYGEDFKQGKASGCNTTYKCVKQMIQGCIDVANELSKADLNNSESVNARMSVEDYKNNVRSIASVLLGTRNIPEAALPSLNSASSSSLMGFCAGSTTLLSASAADTWQSLNALYEAVSAGNNTTTKAACTSLCTNLDYMIQFAETPIAENEFEGKVVVAGFVDNVVLPTFRQLKEQAGDLSAKSVAIMTAPSNAAYTSAATAWKAAHKTWELSEAFHYGPATTLKSEANMDSKADKGRMEGMIKSKNFGSVESGTSLRGFHAIEWLLFDNGSVRTVK